MKAVHIRSSGQAALIDAPRPHAAGSDVVVQVTAAPMCAEHKAFSAGASPFPLGHEAVGVVADAGSSTRVNVGDRVVAMPLNGCGRCPTCLSGDYIYCELAGNLVPSDDPGPGAMAEYIAKPDWLLVAVPDDVPDVHAAMACCGLGASFGAMERIAPGPTGTVLVTGLGPVGLGAVINAKFRGARVIAVEANPYRTELATRLGADVTVDPTSAEPLRQVREATNGRGADAAIDCAGVVGAHRLCLEGVRRRGQVAFVANSHESTPIVVSDDLLHRGVTVFGSWHYNLSHASTLMEQIRRLPTQLDRLVTHTLPMQRVQEAFEIQQTTNCGKVVLIPARGTDA